MGFGPFSIINAWMSEANELMLDIVDFDVSHFEERRDALSYLVVVLE